MYSLIFCKLYIGQVKYSLWSTDFSAAISIVSFLTILLIFNIASVCWIIALIVGSNFLNARLINTPIGFTVFVLSSLLIYFSLYSRFIKNKRYLIIYKQFTKQSKFNNMKGTIITNCYIVLSFILFFGSGYYANK